MNGENKELCQLCEMINSCQTANGKQHPKHKEKRENGFKYYVPVTFVFAIGQLQKLTFFTKRLQSKGESYERKMILPVKSN